MRCDPGFSAMSRNGGATPNLRSSTWTSPQGSTFKRTVPVAASEAGSAAGALVSVLRAGLATGGGSGLVSGFVFAAALLTLGSGVVRVARGV